MHDNAATQPTPEDTLPQAFESGIPGADLIVRASDDVEFRAHAGVLSAASPAFRAKIEEAVRAAATAEADSASSSAVPLPVMQLDHPATVVATLLKFCYPGEAEVPSSLGHLLDVVVSAKRYEMGTVQTLKRQWDAAAKAAPLLAFLLATSHDVKEYALVASKYILETPLEGVYDPAMEHAPPIPFHRLLLHYRSCRTIATTLLSDVDIGAGRYGYSQSSYRSYDREYSPRSPPIVYPPAVPIYPPTVPGRMYASPPPLPRWFEQHVARLSETVSRVPGSPASTTTDLVEAACAAGKWCHSFHALAVGLCRVGKVLQEIPARVIEVHASLNGDVFKLSDRRISRSNSTTEHRTAGYVTNAVLRECFLQHVGLVARQASAI